MIRILNINGNIMISCITLKKISKINGVTARLRHFVPFSTVLTPYRSLIHPYLTYGLTVKARHSRFTLIKSLFYKNMPFVLSTLHVVDLPLSHSSFLRLASQSPCFIFKSGSTLTHNVFNNPAIYLSKLFNSASEIRTYNTRYSVCR